jgi:hypothetical protein
MRMPRVIGAYLLFVLSVLAGGTASAATVNFCTFPESGLPVASGTVLSDQWRATGILFDATPSTVNPIMTSWGPGDCSFFFNPDVFGVVAVFGFVQPGTATPTDASAFSIDAWYDPGESAQLVGLDGTGAVVALAQVTPTDIGPSSRTLTMSISGAFRTVEWRTQGNPGISASRIAFTLSGSSPAEIPTLSEWGLIVLSMLMVLAAAYGLTRRPASR